MHTSLTWYQTATPFHLLVIVKLSPLQKTTKGLSDGVTHGFHKPLSLSRTPRTLLIVGVQTYDAVQLQGCAKFRTISSSSFWPSSFELKVFSPGTTTFPATVLAQPIYLARPMLYDKSLATVLLQYH